MKTTTSLLCIFDIVCSSSSVAIFSLPILDPVYRHQALYYIYFKIYRLSLLYYYLYHYKNKKKIYHHNFLGNILNISGQ